MDGGVAHSMHVEAKTGSFGFVRLVSHSQPKAVHVTEWN